MIKKILLLSFFLLFSILTKAQVYNPVKWKTSVEKISDTEYELRMNAKIQESWHLYSQNVPDGGPLPTHFTFSKNSSYKLIGEVVEEAGKTINDPVFKIQIKFFEKETTFKQRIKIKVKNPFEVKAELEFMVCNDQSCLPPTYEDLVFSVNPVITVNSKEEISKPRTKLFSEDIALVDNDTVQEKQVIKTKPLIAVQKDDSKNLWSIFLLSLLSGFAALLTPCVFPMIPMTVSFFTKQSKNKTEGIRKAIFYGISIIAIYIFLGAVVSWAFGADSLNALSTNVWFNVLFFILLLIFALSFLGAFEIMLPNSLANKVDNQADRGGLIGILFMALALAIVSFSCTGPIVGTLLVEAATRGGIAPFIGMFGFSLALALPFTLFAAFPG